MQVAIILIYYSDHYIYFLVVAKNRVKHRLKGLGSAVYSIYSITPLSFLGKHPCYLVSCEIIYLNRLKLFYKNICQHPVQLQYHLPCFSGGTKLQ